MDCKAIHFVVLVYTLKNGLRSPFYNLIIHTFKFHSNISIQYGDIVSILSFAEYKHRY